MKDIFLANLCNLLGWLSDLQLVDEKVTLNHLVEMISFPDERLIIQISEETGSESLRPCI